MEGDQGRAVSKKEAEEEEHLLGASFYRVYEFLLSFSNPPPIVHRPFVPSRCAINLVRPSTIIASTVVVSSPVVPSSVSSTDYAVVSSVNFVLASAFTSPCIGITR